VPDSDPFLRRACGLPHNFVFLIGVLIGSRD